MLNMIYIRLMEYKRSWPIILIMTAMSILFIYTFGVGFSQEFKPQVGFVDYSQTMESQSLIDGLNNEGNFESTLYEYDPAIKALENGSVIATIVIPEDYVEQAHDGNIKLEFYKVGELMEHVNLKIELEALVSSSLGNINYAEGASQALKEYGVEIDVADLVSDIEHNYKHEPIMELDIKAYESENEMTYDSLKQSFMGFIIFFSMFTVVFGIGAIVEEKERRVWHRQQVSPIGGGKILGSALLVGFIIGFIQIGIMMFSGKYLFDIDLGGSLGALMLVVAFYIIASMCLGLFISGLVKTEQQLSAFTPMIVVSTSMLGGCMWPLELVTNDFVRNLSMITPQRWAMEGFKEVIILGGGFNDVLEPILKLTVLSLIYFVIAIIPYSKSV